MQRSSSLALDLETSSRPGPGERGGLPPCMMALNCLKKVAVEAGM